MSMRLIIAILTLSMLTYFDVLSQEVTNDTVIFIQDTALNGDPPELEYYYIVEEMPEYPGGEMEMFNFIFSNFNYPEGVNACCRITIEFIVDKDGSLRDIEIVKGLEKMFDKEMVRIFSTMPVWEPGRQRGKTVPVKMNYPINISLQ
jgi:hypothetical protein